MTNLGKKTALLLTLGLAHAQQPLFPAPEELWRNQIMPSVADRDPGVTKGNGCKLTPNGVSLICTSQGGTVTSFSAFEGAFEWEYNPPAPAGGIVRSRSQVVFTTPNALTPPYMVYSIIENENSADALTRVVALDMSGGELWISDALDGIAPASPVVSDDGAFVFLTHNAEFQTIGYFTALSALAEGASFYSQSNETTPFAPLGIYHSPIEGNYDGLDGRDNTNDMIMWTMSPKPTDVTINDGHTFGFQFPVGFDGNDTAVEYFLLGENPRTFQGITAPILANSGLNAYFSTTRSGFYAWNGIAGDGRGRFNRGPQGVAGFDRLPGFAGQACYASPALSSSPTEPFVFGGTASTQFVRMNTDLSSPVVVDTTALIKAEARVDPFDRAVYYVEESGLIHQAAFDTLQDQWTFDLASTVEGEMALNRNGYVLYVADNTGLVIALQVGEIPVTPAPTGTPTQSPSASPTGPTLPPTIITPSPTGSTPASAAPTAVPIADGAAGTPAPTGEAVVPETEAPVAAPPSAAASKSMVLLTLGAMVLAMRF